MIFSHADGDTLETRHSLPTYGLDITVQCEDYTYFNGQFGGSDPDGG